MATLHDRLHVLIPKWREQKAKLLKEKGDMPLGDCTVSQAFGGMRGIKGMVCDTSVVQSDKGPHGEGGLYIHGHHLLEIKELWPEQTFLLLLTGEIYEWDDEVVRVHMKEMDRRSQLPQYVYDVLEAMPADSHPMCMLSAAVLVMEKESSFRQWYHKGMTKDEYWIPMLDDALTLLARLPGIAAAVYRLRYNKGDYINWTPGLDWGANYANMLGLNDPTGKFAQLMRLYLHFHCDHEGGNVSANTCHTVGSALSDAYYAVSAGLNGLAGPLHGLANQECLGWLLETMDKFRGAPTEEQIRDYAFETLRAGQLVPGYGHAVLRVTDPRFTGFYEFGQRNLPHDPVFQTVDRIYKVVPKVLQEYSAERVKAGKNPIANFWPNVDAGSGALLHHYGLTEIDYYTVLFSVSRAMGMLTQLIWNRAVSTPMTRPKSVSMNWLEQLAG